MKPDLKVVREPYSLAERAQAALAEAKALQRAATEEALTFAKEASSRLRDVALSFDWREAPGVAQELERAAEALSASVARAGATLRRIK